MKHFCTQKQAQLRLNTAVRASSPQGFSLVEVLVASVILFASVSIAVTLFNLTNRNATLGENKQDEQSAVSEDLAAVLKLNEQYRCTAPGSCSSGGSYPNENQYTSSGKDDLDSICLDSANGGFAQRLVTAVNALALSTQMNELSISRTATIAPNNLDGAPKHLYSVAWKNSAGTLLRQVTLLPTVASWCP